MNAFSSFNEAIRQRSIEIDAAAAEFVRDGFSPWEAQRRAIEHVDAKRKRDAIRRNSRTFADFVRKGGIA
jgi:hypothetical protein